MEQLSSAFRRNADGSWTCVAAATLDGPNGRIQVTAGSTFRRGTIYMGVDIAALLDKLLARN